MAVSRSDFIVQGSGLTIQGSKLQKVTGSCSWLADQFALRAHCRRDACVPVRSCGRRGGGVRAFGRRWKPHRSDRRARHLEMKLFLQENLRSKGRGQEQPFLLQRGLPKRERG